MGLGYRLFVLLCSGVFIYVSSEALGLDGAFEKAVGGSLLWAIANTALYYVYHGIVGFIGRLKWCGSNRVYTES